MELPMQIVEIHNTWDRTITIPHNGQRYDIPVGESRIVPYDAAASLFGDPRAQDTDKVKGRRDLHNHIRGLWNYEFGFDNEEKWQNEKKPQYEAYDPSNPNKRTRVYFIIDDPDGTKALPDALVEPNATQDQRAIEGALAALQAQVAALTAQLAKTQDNAPKSAGPEVVHSGSEELPKAPERSVPVKADSPRVTPHKS
jgi:hypothetical protein